MKNYFLKISISILLILNICSCGLTTALWEARPKGLTLEGFFIDKPNNKIVLVSRIDRDKPSINYTIKDEGENLIRIFEIGQKSVAMMAGLNGHPLDAKGDKVYGESIYYYINKKNLSKEEINELRNLGLKDSNYIYPDELLNSRAQEQTTKDFMRYMNANNGYIMTGRFESNPILIRYPHSEETFSNFCSSTNKSKDCAVITKFKEPFSGVMFDKYTTSEKIVRGAATPFTVVADIILYPFYLMGFIGMGVESK